MVDRIAEIREALDRWDDLSPVEPADVDVDVFVDAARELLDLLDSDALIIRRDEFYDPHDDLIALRDFIDKRETLDFPDIGEVSNQLAAIIAQLTVVLEPQ